MGYTSCLQYVNYHLKTFTWIIRDCEVALSSSCANFGFHMLPFIQKVLGTKYKHRNAKTNILEAMMTMFYLKLNLLHLLENNSIERLQFCLHR